MIERLLLHRYKIGSGSRGMLRDGDGVYSFEFALFRIVSIRMRDTMSKWKPEEPTSPESQGKRSKAKVCNALRRKVPCQAFSFRALGMKMLAF